MQNTGFKTHIWYIRYVAEHKIGDLTCSADEGLSEAYHEPGECLRVDLTNQSLR